ncbi:GroES-like zinc-binding alcohol dehydrogenase family protein [Gossypium australe]|uniref:GroES-like zinc-binding alcohol dehydrogenase family protein n=1 Tax=Gossypium australe TaxID=47621 RepID=A0A5B6USS1_9ROSI|nr:GroES-like zinc-binding alcohol dehydrogenase family protein [Gossypium australe]
MLVSLMNRSELGWKSFEEDDSQLIKGDVFIGTEDRLPSIRFSDQVWQILYKNMSRIVVVKLLGRKVGYQTLSNIIYYIWKPSTPICIMDLENDYFMIKFQSEVDYFKALTKGSWVIQLPILSRFMYRMSVLTNTGEMVGVLVRLDDNIWFFLDLNKPLVSLIKIDARVQSVEYESLSNICFSCGHYGHLQDSRLSVPIQKKVGEIDNSHFSELND